jgi:hypothetical protein
MSLTTAGTAAWSQTIEYLTQFDSRVSALLTHPALDGVYYILRDSTQLQWVLCWLLVSQKFFSSVMPSIDLFSPIQGIINLFMFTLPSLTMLNETVDAPRKKVKKASISMTNDPAVTDIKPKAVETSSSNNVTKKRASKKKD